MINFKKIENYNEVDKLELFLNFKFWFQKYEFKKATIVPYFILGSLTGLPTNLYSGSRNIGKRWSNAKKDVLKISSCCIVKALVGKSKKSYIYLSQQ